MHPISTFAADGREMASHASLPHAITPQQRLARTYLAAGEFSRLSASSGDNLT
jgi:hypothetical protein